MDEVLKPRDSKRMVILYIVHVMKHRYTERKEGRNDEDKYNTKEEKRYMKPEGSCVASDHFTLVILCAVTPCCVFGTHSWMTHRNALLPFSGFKCQRIKQQKEICSKQRRNWELKVWSSYRPLRRSSRQPTGARGNATCTAQCGPTDQPSSSFRLAPPRYLFTDGFAQFAIHPRGRERKQQVPLKRLVWIISDNTVSHSGWRQDEKDSKGKWRKCGKILEMFRWRQCSIIYKTIIYEASNCW
jgi:hypothetical protein